MMTTAGTSDYRSTAMRNLGSEGAFVVLARARELEAQGAPIVHLEVGEPDFDTPEHIKRAGIVAIEANATHYAPNAGIPELRDIVAAYAGRFRRIAPFQRDEVVIGPGCKQLIWNALAALLDPGNEMIYADPAYPTYASAASFIQAKAVPVPLLESTNFRLDLDRLAAVMNPRTKVLVLNSPQNPTGGVLTRSDLETIAELAIRNDVIVLSDEIYSRNIYDAEFVSIASLPGMRERTIIVDGFSKAYAMTGWRLGYLIAPKALAAAVTLFANNTYACTSTFVQHAGVAALQGPDDSVRTMVAEFRRRRDAIVAGLNSLPGITCKVPDGAFYAFPNVSQITSDDRKLALFLLEQAHVAAIGGSMFGPAGAGHLRFSYANSLDNIALAIERMRTALPKFKT
ncbi:MAG TPA: pyridoxal phosphate-dependent aminotransferase [Candidatus Baltobacteraceae bacterium]|jgi:aspartate/methionine/tyrosine aminotransferase|nr:pyridoxal phosphate-dependent aminotransferase [Candidatus Baltobacteraceae bacterium]